MQGSNNVIIEVDNSYEPVAAYTANALPRNNGSGTDGYYHQGANIFWTTDETPGGITNRGWYTDFTNSPFYNFSEDQIQDVIEYANQHNNLNIYFSRWGNDETKDRSHFIKEEIDDLCWTFIF